MGRTKKVGTTGRYGVRYGSKIKQKAIDIEKNLRKKHLCPDCQKQRVRRLSSGIWQCGKCRLKFAGKAYRPN